MSIRSVLSIAISTAACLAIGCGQPAQAPKAATSSPAHAETNELAGRNIEHTHDAWWCNEHGVPEEVCGQCNSKLAAEFQKKGDWCKEHDRPDSQCFQCHPELEAKF